LPKLPAGPNTTTDTKNNGHKNTPKCAECTNKPSKRMTTDDDDDDDYDDDDGMMMMTDDDDGNK